MSDSLPTYEEQKQFLNELQVFLFLRRNFRIALPSICGLKGRICDLS